MTEKELEARYWLNRAFYANKKAKAIDALLQQCRERAQGLSSGMDGDGIRISNTQNSTENALMKLANIEEKAVELRAECTYTTAEILSTILQLHDDDLETVLINRYILFYTIEKTAEVMNYAPRTVKLKQKQAIEKLCPLLPCNAFKK